MRKAIAETALVAIILAVAGGLVLGGVAYSVIGKGRGQVDLNACKSNVALAIKSKQFVNLNSCFTRDVGTLDYSGESAKYTDEMASQVARYLYECRFQFGELGGVPWKGDFFNGIDACFVCSTFNLPKDEAGIETSDILAWMKRSKMTGGETYYEYLSKSAPGANPEFLFTDAIEPNANKVVYVDALVKGTPYAVVHWASTERRLVQVAGGGLTWSGVESAESGYSMVFITPATNLNKACEITFTRYP
ncbi:hypothetical protein HY493_02215 [Candidatus Woesearchaeota archaeon]|nr:hypothetical protein [Candidatus Woesearchaeota archaeon]